MEFGRIPLVSLKLTMLQLFGYETDEQRVKPM